MKVVCVYKSGGDYDPRYVAALSASLEEHMTEDYEFYCLTDRPEEVLGLANIVELQHDLPGWWSKIELFNPDLFPDDHILYFDLDVLILKEISDLLKVVKTSFYPVSLRSIDPLGWREDWPSSSIMAWRCHNMDEVYTEFFRRGNVIEETEKNTGRAGQRTDQGFIRTVVNPDKFQDYLPKEYIVFKYDYTVFSREYRKSLLNERCHILNWTGKPRFHKMTDNYKDIQQIWESRYQLLMTNEDNKN